MELKVSQVIAKFHETLNQILGNKIIDIVIHGSTVDGSFIQGKGDIDFIVLLNQEVSDNEYDLIIDYHQCSRQKRDLESQLEGCYLILNNENKLNGGIYIGSTESRWKRFSGEIFTSLDKAHIKAVNYSLYKENYIDNLFHFEWDDVKSEIKMNIENTLTLLEKIPDFDFKLHALHSSARSYYTYSQNIFVSKLKALEWMETEDCFSEYRDFLSEIKTYKSMLSETEKIEMSQLELFKINEIVLKIQKTMQ